RATPSSLYSYLVLAASRPPEINNTLRNCRNVLLSIISNARTLLEQLPPDGSASPTPLVSSSANAELVASLLRDFINGDEEADCQQNNTSEGGQSGSHNKEQHGTGVDAEPEGTQRAGAEGASDRYGRGVHIVDFGAEQMGAALVAQLETLAAATPSHCYNKIRVINFDSPNFSQAQTPALGYIRGSIYLKDSFKLSPEEIRSFFQAIFDNPPSEALPYFVGPIPMSPEYVPLYISQCGRTPATLHVEDGNLGSLWLFIPECEKTNIERRMKELYGPGRVPCLQEIRHYNAIISLALLEEWDITYYLDYCLPGEMIVTRQNTYHQVLNMGPNIAESVNIEFNNTPDMPAGYVWCERGSGLLACSPHVITASDFSSSPVEARSLTHGRFTDAQIYDIFVTKLGYQANTIIELLTCLFFAVASPEAISQLRQVCCLRRTSNSGYLFPKGETIGEAMKALDKVEDIFSSHSIIRRYYLLCLAERRESLVQEHKLKAAQRTRTRNSGMEKIQKVESLALQDLYYKVYSDRDPLIKLQTKLKNRLRHGRNWAFLAQKFLIGVLALLSTGSDTALTDSQIKRVAAAVDDVYTNVLFNTEPTQCYPFKQVDQDTLCNALFDDKRLLEYCTKTVL
ncbi:hypothetical protein BU23DRAFT_551400, partial [Bimuria novae-zelandiae CBS 107.79]